MKKKYFVIVGVGLILVLIASIVFITHKPQYIAMDTEILDEVFSSQFDFAYYTRINSKEEFVFKNGSFQGSLNVLDNGFFIDEQKKDEYEKDLTTMRKNVVVLKDGARIGCYDWMRQDDKIFFYEWRFFKEEYVRDGMRYTCTFLYQKDDFYLSFSINCTNPKDTKNIRAMYASFIQYIKENAEVIALE